MEFEVERYSEVNMDPREQKEKADPQDTIAPAKRPYVKPEVRYERVFETMALSCGKVSSTQGQCRFNRKNS
jgi:hypothetical protein